MTSKSEATLIAPSGRFAVVASRFNTEIVDRLVQGALDGLRKQFVAETNIELFRVPGALELPLACQKLADTGRYVAIIALGAVIRGDTDHYDYVCRGVTDGLMRATLDSGVPILSGVLTCQIEELALERAGGSAGNKGYDVAIAAVEMVRLIERIES